MTPNKQALWPHDLKKPFVNIATANTNRDGTGTLGTVYTVPTTAPSAVLTRVDVKARGTTTAGMVRLFIDRSGTFLFIAEIEVTAITPSAILKSFEGSFVPENADGFKMQPGDILKAGTHNAESFDVRAEAGEF